MRTVLNEVDCTLHDDQATGKKTLTRSAGVMLAASLILTPMSMLMPTAASAHESAVEAARVATSDLAVTEKPLEQISAPESYLENTQADAASVLEAELQLQPISAEVESATQTREDVSLARALVSSPTAILGVTFPLNNVDEDVTISYRTRLGQQWSEWKDMELADGASAPGYAESVTLGTEPVPLTDTEEVEVAVRTADGDSLPGAHLTVIEPELSVEELSEAQIDAHGQQAVEAVESLVDDKVNKLPSEQTSSAPSQPSEEQESVETHTPAEEAEAAASREVYGGGVVGSQGTSGVVGLFRAVGPTADGRSYVTDMPGLTVTTRKGWGADEKVMDWKPEKVTFKGAVVHHTAGSNNYTKAQVPGIVQGIYRYHAVTLGWGDVGYHLLVDKFGGVWEGRAGGLTNSVEGGHAFGANTTTFGISVLGDYMTVKPSDEAIDAVAKAVAWKLKVHKITNLDATFTTKGKQWGKSSIQLPVVSAHRHVGGTTCPGDAFMTRWDELQEKVKSYSEDLRKDHAHANSAPAQTEKQKRAFWKPTVGIGQGWNSGRVVSAGAFSGPGRTDAILIDREGKMWLYPGVDDGRFIFGRKQIGHGWQGLDQISAGVDFDGDSYPDIIARQKSTAKLLLYSGNGRGGFKSSRQIGHGWDGFKSIFVLPDVYHGHPVVYGVHPNGLMRAYPTDGRGTFVSMIQIGSGWAVMRDMNAIGDLTSNGHADMVVVDDAGRLWLYEGKGDATFGQRHQIGHGWDGLRPILRSPRAGSLWAVQRNGLFLRYTLESFR